MQVVASDKSGNIFFTKTYGTGTFSGKTVLDTMKPGELINRIAHEAVSQLLEQAAGELEATLKARTQTTVQSQSSPVAGPTGGVSAAKPDGGGTIEERLKKLKALHDQGLISKEAYDKKQQEILSSY
jgi:hypothetical protein